ncbi:MAG: helix-turn-helix transcriptional regulator [Oscillospiraceae bacterium]|nr:helix-turn-helix transcriptional regulator [Oscillospiraceae bacterium]
MENRLKDVRESRNATQEQIAKQIGVSQVFISRVEKGTKKISLDLAAEIADYLDVSLDEIAGRTRTAETRKENVS